MFEAPAQAQSTSYYNLGVRWLGRASSCVAPIEWTAKRLFTARMAPPASELCVYTWIGGPRVPPPTTKQIGALFAVSGGKEMVEDVPVLVAMSPPLAPAQRQMAPAPAPPQIAPEPPPWSRAPWPLPSRWPLPLKWPPLSDLRRWFGLPTPPPPSGPVPDESAHWSNQEQELYSGLRAALRQHVGDARMLPASSWPSPPPSPWRPRVRITLLDTAPTAGHDDTHPGADRHGDTLVYVIRDLVCPTTASQPAPAPCAVEVTTRLALPQVAPGTSSGAGGSMGTLVDLATAIHDATEEWRTGRLNDPPTTPEHLILNLSLGWEDLPGTANCPADPSSPPAAELASVAVQSILQYAAQQGVLIIAAAGNDAGGPSPRTGLTCPGNYQKLAQPLDPQRPVLFAVSGVDYADHPLETVREGGRTGLVALGLGAVAWRPGTPIPPALTGASVASAVVAAVSAIAWTYRPLLRADQIGDAVYQGGSPVPTIAQQCTWPASGCQTRRASVCGALRKLGLPAQACTIPARKPHSSPSLPGQMAALLDWVEGQPMSHNLTPMPPRPSVPRYVVESLQAAPWTFPTPISATCPTCVVSGSAAFALDGERTFAIPSIGQRMYKPMLVVRFEDGDFLDENDVQWAIQLDEDLPAGGPYEVAMPPLPGQVRSAYLTGLDEEQSFSITEQILVSH